MLVKHRDFVMSRILPPKADMGPTVNASFRMPKVLREALDKVSEETGYTLTEVMVYFLNHSLEEYRREDKKGPKK